MTPEHKLAAAVSPADVAAACVAGWHAGRPKAGKELKATLPEVPGQSRDLAGKRVGVSGKAIEKAVFGLV